MAGGGITPLLIIRGGEGFSLYQGNHSTTVSYVPIQVDRLTGIPGIFPRSMSPSHTQRERGVKKCRSTTAATDL